MRAPGPALALTHLPLDLKGPQAVALEAGLGMKRTGELLMAVREGFHRHTSAYSMQRAKCNPLRREQTLPFLDGGRIVAPQVVIIYAS